MDLVLPCRYAPGPLANDNFYQPIWTLLLNGQSAPISSNNNNNFQANNSDFTLTIFKLNPILAMYNYTCGIEFLNDASQPYNLRSTTGSADDAIEVTISGINGEG